MKTLVAEIFVDLARGYCAWCESSAVSEKSFEEAALWLSRLYAAGLDLPDVEPLEDEEISTSSEASRIASYNLSKFWERSYRLLYDPRVSSDEPAIQGNLGDDLSGVYDDIKHGLEIYNAGQVDNAVWNWKFSHQYHWGQHATGALFAIHWLIIGGLE